MQNKRGQVYIISAIIIILILVGLASLTNRATYKPQPTKFYELGQQLSGESFVLSAYGEYHGEGSQEIINNFTQGPFSNYIESTGAEFVVVYGNKDSITYTKCLYEEKDTITASTGTLETDFTQQQLKCEEPQTDVSPNKDYTLDFKDQSYTLDLGQNQGYYYVFSKEEGSDTFTYQG